MNEKVRELRNSPDHFTLKEAASRVGIHPTTFKKYAANIGITGTSVSKYTFFTADDVKRVAKVAENNTPLWIRMIEHDTGKKIKTIIFQD